MYPARVVHYLNGCVCVVGFSGGVALQVHYARLIPRLARSVLVVPVGVAVGASAVVYQHALTQCGKRWTAALTGGTQTRKYVTEIYMWAIVKLSNIVIWLIDFDQWVCL